MHRYIEYPKLKDGDPRAKFGCSCSNHKGGCRNYIFLEVWPDDSSICCSRSCFAQVLQYQDRRQKQISRQAQQVALLLKEFGQDEENHGKIPEITWTWKAAYSS